MLLCSCVLLGGIPPFGVVPLPTALPSPLHVPFLGVGAALGSPLCRWPLGVMVIGAFALPTAVPHATRLEPSGVSKS